MNNRKENLITILLILLGVIIVPVLFIWSADTIFALTIKTFVAVFFLLLLIRAVPRKKDEPHHRQSTGIGMTMAITIICSRERRAPPTTATGTNTKQ